jgi:hypothetical protein
LPPRSCHGTASRGGAQTWQPGLRCCRGRRPPRPCGGQASRQAGRWASRWVGGLGVSRLQSSAQQAPTSTPPPAPTLLQRNRCFETFLMNLSSTHQPIRAPVRAPTANSTHRSTHPT